LHFAVTHAGKVSAHDIGGGLQHAFFEDNGFDVEPRPPRETRLRIGGDRCIHAARLDAEFVDCGGDQFWHAFGQSKMQFWFYRGIDPNMKMEQMHVDWRGNRAGARIVTNRAVGDRGPDRYASSAPPPVLEKRSEALAATCASFFVG
jgi:hypothetical protein